MKRLLVFYFIFAIFTDLDAQTSLKWSSYNGCIYTLSENPNKVIYLKDGLWSFQISKKNKNVYTYKLLDFISMHVLCPNIDSYCDKSDSIYNKAINNKNNCYGEFFSILSGTLF